MQTILGKVPCACTWSQSREFFVLINAGEFSRGNAVCADNRYCYCRDIYECRIENSDADIYVWSNCLRIDICHKHHSGIY